MERNDTYEVFKGKDKLWYIRRTASNGEIVAISEGHQNRIDAVTEAQRQARTLGTVLP